MSDGVHNCPECGIECYCGEARETCLHLCDWQELADGEEPPTCPMCGVPGCGRCA